jgi:hypothetical protein
LQGFRKAVEGPADLRFAILNLMSANEGMRWDIETTRQAIGYIPQDGHPTYSSDSLERQEQLICSTIESSARQLKLVASGPF